jgi:hypothetical protein
MKGSGETKWRTFEHSLRIGKGRNPGLECLDFLVRLDIFEVEDALPSLTCVVE